MRFSDLTRGPSYGRLQEIVMLTLIEKTGRGSAGRADRGFALASFFCFIRASASFRIAA
jgi:hypothetical protein